MTIPSSGLTQQTQNILNTTVAQAATQVSAPSYNATGTPQTPGGQGPAATYPQAYGSAAAVLTNPASTPAQNEYGITGATATSSGATGSTVNGIAPIGPAQGNAQNQSAMIDVIIPNSFGLIYQQLLTMAQYTYRI